MSIWAVGLATRERALRVAKWGGIACWVQAARRTIGTLARMAGDEKALDVAIVGFIGASLVPIILVIAGTRLRGGNGLVWGGCALALLALELIIYTGIPTNVESATHLLVNIVVFALVGNGVRAAFVLRDRTANGSSASPL